MSEKKCSHPGCDQPKYGRRSKCEEHWKAYMRQYYRSNVRSTSVKPAEDKEPTYTHCACGCGRPVTDPLEYMLYTCWIKKIKVDPEPELTEDEKRAAENKRAREYYQANREAIRKKKNEQHRERMKKKLNQISLGAQKLQTSL